MPWTDVFDSDLHLPEKVCIVAPGPNGAGHYREIPSGFTVIAVSKAVLIPDLRPSLWMMNHVRQDWFAAADKSFTGIRVFKQDAAQESKLINSHHAGERYSFDPPKDALGLESFVTVDGCIRIGATISACAVQLAYNFGAREILLCGVDMSGDGYYDGTLNVHPHHGTTWPAAARLNVLIKWLTEHRGLKFSTLSPTKLDLPFHSS